MSTALSILCMLNRQRVAICGPPVSQVLSLHPACRELESVIVYDKIIKYRGPV